MAPPLHPGYVDAHCHLDLFAASEVPAVLARARAAGVTRLVVAGVDPPGWAAQRALVAAHPGLARTAGLHPWAAAERAAHLEADLSQLAETFEESPQPVALGELGLDHLRTPPAARAAGEAAFRAQLALARAWQVPVVLHVVQAHGRALEILAQDGLPAAGGVVHGFSGSAEVALEYVRLGLHIGVGFVIHRPHARKLKAAVAALPAHRLLLETDAPAEPAPGGSSPSEPADLLGIAQAVAAVRSEAAEALLEASSRHAAALFGLPP